MPKPTPNKPATQAPPPAAPEASTQPAPLRPAPPSPRAITAPRWSADRPTEEGAYWFAGWLDPLDVVRHEPGMYFVRASVGPTKRLMFVSGSLNVFREAVGVWLKADVPAMPDLTAYKA